MTLDQLQPGESAVVTGVDTDEYSTLKLMTFGIVEGSTIKCMSKLYTAMEVNLYGTCFAMSNHIASKFICEKI
jgi:Fe2+ transport system protein FeoA